MNKQDEQVALPSAGQRAEGSWQPAVLLAAGLRKLFTSPSPRDERAQDLL